MPETLIARSGTRTLLEEGHDTVSSVSKALSLLEALADSTRDAIGVSELAIGAHVPKSTAHRLLKAMEERGFVSRVGSKYRLGGRFARMHGRPPECEHDELRASAVPELERLFEETRSTVHLAVLNGANVLYLEKITAGGGCRLPSRVGGMMPATCTAVGKAILAFSGPEALRIAITAPLPRLTPYSVGAMPVLRDQLLQVRADGIAYEREESTIGFSCVAAPIVIDHRAVGAVSVSVPRNDGCESFATNARRAALRIRDHLLLDRACSGASDLF